jgi:HTH-type transcriptional regulator/antitoxin HigA
VHDPEPRITKECVPQSRISDILSGRRAISKDLAKKLAQRFNVAADLFI